LALGTFKGHCQDALDPTRFFTIQEIELANTAKDVTYLTQEEKAIFLYNNLARMYPKKFYNLYRVFLEEGGRTHMLENHYYKTLATDLQNNAPAGALMPDRVMFELAECWALESGARGIVGHDRIDCEGGFSAENCAYGNSEGLEIVMQLLIDYGIESLGHRVNMLNPGYRGLGVAIRAHTGYGTCAVQDFSWTNDQLRAKAEEERLAAEARQAELDQKLVERGKEFDLAMAQWTQEERSNADVCRSLSYLNDLERDFYFYVNLMRLYPQKFKKVLWDKGPFFDELLENLRADLHKESGYLMIATYLKLSSPSAAIIPQERLVTVGRCLAKGFANGQSNLNSCLQGGGSWSIESYYEQEDYRDIMTFLMDAKTFNAVFKQSSIVVLNDGMKVTVR
jgi:hypothetical protein